MKCPKCGAQNPDEAIYCQNCGAPLEENAQQSQPGGFSAAPENGGVYGGLTADEAALIGVKQDFYADKFSKMRTTGNKCSWNWCAFLVFPCWAIYRKLYKESIIYLIAANAINMVLGDAYPGLVISLVAGLFGNWLYMRAISSHAVTAAGMPEMEKQAYIQKFGGVSTKNVWILIGVLVLISIVTSMVRM